MEVAVEIREDKPILVYSGRLDDEASVRFGRELTAWAERMLNRSVTDFIVDFSAVTFVSSVVLRSMLSMARRVRARGGVLCLSNPSPELEETFRVIGFREIFESYGGTFKTTDAAAPRLALTPSETVRLDVIIGDRAFICRDGDSLGTEGSIAPQLFAGLPVSGQKVALSGDHTLQIGEVRQRVLVTSPEKGEEEVEPIQIQIEDVFSRTATWLERAISTDQEKRE
jgi:anti-sigma B factor antagonist